MRDVVMLAWVAMLGVACGKGDSLTRAPSDKEWKEFRGVELLVPKGTNAGIEDGVLPGPEGMGGIPTGERPTLTLTMAGAHGFYIQVVKSSQATTLEGMKYVIEGNHVGTNLVGKQTAHGWELSYVQPIVGDPSTTIHVHTIATDIAEAHFECTYSDQKGFDLAISESICRSIRVKASG